MGTDSPTPKRRWRPRFSLLTLVLGVVFVGACSGLWWRWEPWYSNPEASDRIPARPSRSFFDLDMVAPDRIRCISCNECMIRRFLHGELLFSFVQNGQPPGIPVGFLDNDTILFAPMEGDGARTSDKFACIIWSRRRPEYWWGIAWLPEFWIALLSGGALAVIAVRRLRAREAVKQEAA